MPQSLRMSDHNLTENQNRHHAKCFMCSAHDPDNLNIDFEVYDEQKKVRANLFCHKRHVGYDGMLHGGIITALLDCAMANCLFACDVVAFTANLQVRFRKPVVIEDNFILEAQLKQVMPPLYILEATLSQDDEIKTKAVGKFIRSDQHDSVNP